MPGIVFSRSPIDLITTSWLAHERVDEDAGHFFAGARDDDEPLRVRTFLAVAVEAEGVGEAQQGRVKSRNVKTRGARPCGCRASRCAAILRPSQRDRELLAGRCARLAPG